jgi:hypothetical protein
LLAICADAPRHHPTSRDVLKLPTVLKADEPAWLLVETNNSGVTTDEFDVHLKAARRATEQGVGAIAANGLELPMLVPAFPRPGGDRHNVYTQALDSDSIDIRSGPMQRLDLQLLAMIDDAIERLRMAGIYSLMGESMQPDRWEFVRRVYEESGADIRSVTYPGIGHGTNGRINTDIADFLADSVLR